MNAPIPVGLIGLGRHGNRYLRHLVEEETGGQLVAISRQQVDKGRQQAKQHGIQYFQYYHDLITDPAIQAVLVVTPPSLNMPIALEAIKHRKAVLLEKPFSLNYTEGRHIVEAAKQAGVPLMTGHTLRYEPVIQKIQDIGSSLRPWQSLTGTMHLEEPPEARTQGRYHGVLLEFGIHLLDWVRFMLPDEKLTVTAKMTRLSPKAPERGAEINLTTSSGLSCHLDIAQVSQGRLTQVEIIGTTGHIQGDWTNNVVQTFEQETRTSHDVLSASPTIITMLKDFFQALRKGTPVPITGEDGLRAVELADACYEAEKNQQPILVP